MRRDEHLERRSAEHQQQWHGFGSPVGLGIGLACVGAFVLMLSLAVHYVR
jgi:hypothetical protein